MRTLILLIAAVAGCARGPAAGTSLAGAPTPREAATEFLNAAKAQDLQAMATFWGDERGAARDNMPRSELDQRLVIMQPCYDHERFQILEDRASSDGKRLMRVELARGSRTKTPMFQLIRGPSNRWYVLDADYAAMGDFCR